MPVCYLPYFGQIIYQIMNTNVEKISHLDLLLYHMRRKRSSSSTSKQTDTVYPNLPRIFSLEDHREAKKEQTRDLHVNIYREFFSNTSNTVKCCIQNYWLASDEVVVMDIHTAASLGDCGGIDAALARYENISCCSHISGWTPLMFAASRNHLVAVKHLILNGANVCTHSKKQGRTALDLAASGGSCETVEVIADETVKLKAVGYVLGSNLLFESLDDTNRKALPWLQQDFQQFYNELQCLFEVENLGLDSWDIYGWTALMHAIYFGTLDVVKLLMKKGSNINVCDINGKTPLIVAIECMRVDIVFTLLNAGADPSATSKRGLTAIEYAEIHKCPGIINLVKAATDFKSEWNNEGLRPVILILGTLGLHKYIPIFIEHNIDIKKFNQLTEDELRGLGLTNMGPRKKVLSAVRDRIAETK